MAHVARLGPAVRGWIDCRKGRGYFANDLMQWCTHMGLSREDPRLVKQMDGQHHALYDARDNPVVYDFLARYHQSCSRVVRGDHEAQQ